MEHADLEVLAQHLRSAKGGDALVITGAGISRASGIPTFRGDDPGAVWKRDVTELGTFRFFLEDPVASWRWYLSRFDKVLEAKPNAAHLALAALERWQTQTGGTLLLVTQNVDTLHEQAGSRNLIKVHGSADRIRCAADGCVHAAPSGSLPRSQFDIAGFLREPGPHSLPRCPACGGLIRQHVLWFDEYYASHADFQFDRVCEAAARADLYLFVGTSFAVGVTDMILGCAVERRKPVLSIDPSKTAPPRGVTPLYARAEELLPAACDELGVTWR